jgi:hypothetical protein
MRGFAISVAFLSEERKSASGGKSLVSEWKGGGKSYGIDSCKQFCLVFLVNVHACLNEMNLDFLSTHQEINRALKLSLLGA